MISELEIKQLIRYVESESGIDFSKADEFQLNKRIKLVVDILEERSESFSSLFSSDFSTFLGDENLKNRIINIFTNNETAFFRDRRPFDLLENLFELNKINKNYLSVLSLPCSSGQEAYSILFKLLKLGYSSNSIDLTAADVDTDVLARAEKGSYNKFELMRGVSDVDIKEYFDSDNGTSIIKNKYRSMISFRHFNLVKDTLDKEFDIIFLRNVLFYFKDAQKESVLLKISKSLKKDGILILGNGEKVPCPLLKEMSFEGMPYYIRI